MKTYKYICFSTATDERYDELEKWYTSQHFHDVMTIPGFVGVRMYKCCEPQFREIDRPLPYVVIWDLEAESQEEADAAFETMRQNGQSGKTIFSEAFGEWWDMCVEPISDYVKQSDAEGMTPEEIYDKLSNTQNYK